MQFSQRVCVLSCEQMVEGLDPTEANTFLVFWLWGWDWCLTELWLVLRAYCSSPDENEWVNKWMK
jgi:hypothetical protein